ncbi:MAG TPA: class I SAM-dependent methyltransferase [Candidatus Paceibacterota bacterium]|nr:class I SAM-dependent methyltransferase [Candidatus Paceibacterota bacterium]
MSQHRAFWDKEYKTGEHLALSTEPAEDLLKFARYLEREHGAGFLNPATSVLDLGCGNGRNLIHLARHYGCPGTGYDISAEAIKQAEAAGQDLSLSFKARSMAGRLELPDESATLVLDMMSSHFLRQKEREALREEILRVLAYDGWLFFKSFLAEEDLHVKRLLRDHPADEPNAYIHPKLGVYEYVWTVDALKEFFGPYFEIRKIEKSHKHLLRGKAFKRRTVSAYLQKK